jgi:hypothetical protein
MTHVNDRRTFPWAATAAVLLVLIGSARIVSTYTVFNHTIDEPDHLAAGMEWLSVGKYRYEDKHTPLARISGAIGPFLAGERWHGGPASYQEGYRILGHGAHYDRILALGRAGILPFFWVGCAVVYLWARRIAGSRAAVVSVFLFSTLPPVLAHSGLLTTDMALTAFVGGAALVSLTWAVNPGWRQSILLGALTGLAAISKFSAVVFLPAAWLAMYAWHLIRTRQGPRCALREIARRKWHVAAVLGVAFLVVWAGYLFSFGKVEFLHTRLPAPRYFLGMHALWENNKTVHPAYLLGRRSAGFWYYYPVVLAIKTPLAMLVLLLWSLWRLLRAPDRFGAVMPLALTLGVLLAALLGHMNVGVRHVLPVYVAFAVLCGAAVASAFRARPSRRAWLPMASMVALLAWHAISGALQHPDYIAYTNEIAGSHPERFVADSDLDWGQDMKRLGVFLNQVGATKLTFVPFNGTYALAGHPLPPMVPGVSEHPSAGWNAVSVTIWKVFGFPSWADGTPPQHRIGRSILLWYFPQSPPPARLK